MIDMIRNQFSQDDQDLDAMKIYRDELLVKILEAKNAVENRKISDS